MRALKLLNNRDEIVSNNNPVDSYNCDVLSTLRIMKVEQADCSVLMDSLSAFENKFYLYHVMLYRMDECVEGGESILLDAYAVVEEMRKKHPQHFDTLVRVPATFEQIYYDRYILLH